MTKADKIRQAEAEEQAALAVLTILSVEQQNAIDLLVTGKLDIEVATTVGLTRQTICVWRNHH
jgi:FixJ family two-component response regulator